MRMFAIYDDPTSASRGIERLLRASFDARRIRVVFFDQAGPEAAIIRHRTRPARGAAIGGIVGCLVGVATSLVGLATWEVGLVGGLISGLVAGVFVGVAFWNEEVDLPQRADTGGVLLAVQAETERRRTQALRAFESSGGHVLTRTELEVEP